MTLPRDEAVDRMIERFLARRADEVAGLAAPPEQVAAAIAARLPRAVDRQRMVLAVAVTLLVAGAVVIGLIGAAQRARGGAIGPIPGNLAWSPDGSMLAFSTLELAPRPGASSGGDIERAIEIWVVKADGSGLRQLARDADDPAGFRGGATITWSPDGRFLAYDLPSHASQWYAIQPVDSANRTVLNGLPIAWSPVDDRLLAQVESAAGQDLAVVTAQGGSAPITTTGDAVGGAWSPDGSRILFTTGAVSGTQTATSSIVVVTADGSAAHQLGVCCDLGWAPDGSAIYYWTPDRALRAIAPDGTDDHLVASSFEWSGWSWAPDGSTSVMPGQRGLQLVKPGGMPTSLTDVASDRDPSWSPDGSWIAFWGTRAEGTGGYVVSSVGGGPTLVAPDALGTSRLAWRPGTSQLAFVRAHRIEVVSADGTGDRVVVQAAALGGRPDEQALSTVGRIVIGPDGPDHDTYRVPAPSGFELVVENTTDDTWRIDLEGFDIQSEDCRPEGIPMGLVAYRAPHGTQGIGLATPPDFCGVAPHSVVRVVKPQLLGGAALVSVTSVLSGVRYPVILEFGP